MAISFQEPLSETVLEKLKNKFNLDIRHSNGTLENIFPNMLEKLKVDSKVGRNEITFDLKSLMDVKNSEIVVALYDDSKSTNRTKL